MSEFESVWAELVGESAAEDGYTRRRVCLDAKCSLFLAVTKPGNLRTVIIEANTNALPLNLEFQKSVGFEVLVHSLVPGPSGRLRMILKNTDAVFQDVFASLAVDLLSNVRVKNDEKTALSALTARLHRWQLFLKRFPVTGLTEHEQLGLFGELWFLKRVVLPAMNPEAAVRAWVGPRGANQDFNFQTLAVEVKASASSPHQRVHISNVRQLDDFGSGGLLMLFQSFDCRMESGDSLPGLIADLRALIVETGGAVLSAFNDGLMESGYLDIHESIYQTRRYNFRESSFYRVGPDFPRILEDDLKSGVGEVKYTISIAACKPFAITSETAISEMKRTSNE